MLEPLKNQESTDKQNQDDKENEETDRVAGVVVALDVPRTDVPSGKYDGLETIPQPGKKPVGLLGIGQKVHLDPFRSDISNQFDDADYYQRHQDANECKERPTPIREPHLQPVSSSNQGAKLQLPN
jgi:hypothetical protein